MSTSSSRPIRPGSRAAILIAVRPPADMPMKVLAAGASARMAVATSRAYPSIAG
jgi:hypothetical protein